MSEWTRLYGFFELSLEDQLTYAKEHPFKVPLDFETRFRVWRDQVLPDRLMQFRMHNDVETGIRFYSLTVRDIVRLYKRAIKEFFDIANDREIDQETLEFHQRLYFNRILLLEYIHDGFMNDMVEIMEA